MSTAPATYDMTTARRFAITATVMFASSMYALDWTIAAVALPHMQGTFSATQDQISWVLTSYIVISAITMPTTAWLAERLGRKRLYLIAISGFTISSALCGLADSLETEIAYRLAQGAFGAFLIPLSQSILLDSYPPAKHAKAMAIWSVGVMLAPVLGPTVGGYLTHEYSWRWVFLINIPMGMVGILGGIIFLTKTRHNQSARGFDWLGFTALAIGVGALQTMLDRGERLDWFSSGEVLIECTLVMAGMYIFVMQGLTAKAPMINLRLFRDRNYALGTLFAFLYGLLSLAPLVMLPPFLQELQGYPITEVGLLMTPRGLGMMFSMILFGRFSTMLPPKTWVILGFFLLGLSSLAMSQWTLEVSAWQISWTGWVQGMGAGIVVAPLNYITFSTLDPRHRTEASSVWNLVRSLGSSMGLAIALAILVRMSSTSYAGLSEHLSPYNKSLWLFGGTWLPTRDNPALSFAEAEIARQAAMIGYLDVFYLSAIASVIVVPLVFLIKKAPNAPAR
ncbi:MAG: DHA2 family efflux MFS transporter permease subunit [Alphaproteobacteria bacterium]|nr:DHA2 family efflux MFS transporter permease subunit [Alphaproteobacteria bacterium]